jgi:hypothetical protein
MSNIEKEVQELNAKVDMLLRVFGLDGSRPLSTIKQEVKKVLDLKRQREERKAQRATDTRKPCR